MILSDQENRCLIGAPPRDVAREVIYACSINLTNSNGIELRTVSQFERRCPKQLRASGALSPVRQAVRGSLGGHNQTVRIHGQVSTVSNRNTVSRVCQGWLGVPACVVCYFVHRRSPLRRQRRPIEQRVRGSYRAEISRLLHGLVSKRVGRLAQAQSQNYLLLEHDTGPPSASGMRPL